MATSNKASIFKPKLLNYAIVGIIATQYSFAVAENRLDVIDTAGSDPVAISADGSVFVGEDFIAANTVDPDEFLWVSGGTNLEFYGLSGDGQFVVGTSDNGAFVSDVGIDLISYLPGLATNPDYSVWDYAGDASYDGSVIVGGSLDDSPWAYHAVRWVLNSEGSYNVEDLGSLMPVSADGVSGAVAVNTDGRVVVGWSDFDSAETGYVVRAFRWEEGLGMQNLGLPDDIPLDQGYWSWANDVSNSGDIVVGGYNTLNIESDWIERAFIWTESGGMVDIGALEGHDSAEAYAVSGDGLVVVGVSEDSLTSEERAFRYSSGAMQSIEEWLINSGVDVADSIVTEEAVAVNQDGSVIIGELESGELFIARGNSAPLNSSTPGFTTLASGSGLITVSELNSSMQSSVQAAGAMTRMTSTTIQGAHSRPMMRYVDEGETTAWVAGDWGRDDHNDRDGTVGLAEIGVGKNFGPAQVNLSAGHAWSDQDTFQGGNVDSDGYFLMVEGIIPVSKEHNLFSTLSAFGYQGEADIKRGYLNAGNRDASKASPDTRTWGVRARLDWMDAFALGNSSLSPYTDLSYVDSKVDSYTETGGGFPAQFDERTENITELRLGVNATLPIENSALYWVGSLEAAHRFDDEGTASSGQLIGLNTFKFDGESYDQNWFKAGVGIEGQLGSGKFSFMVNGTTEGEMPNAWIATSYQVKF